MIVLNDITKRYNTGKPGWLLDNLNLPIIR